MIPLTRWCVLDDNNDAVIRTLVPPAINNPIIAVAINSKHSLLRVYRFLASNN